MSPAGQDIVEWNRYVPDPTCSCRHEPCMPVTVTPLALPTGPPLSVTDWALAAGTHTVAREPTGTWAVSAKLVPETVQLELTRPSGVVS